VAGVVLRRRYGRASVDGRTTPLDWHSVVLLWHTATSNERAARLHVPSCQVCKTVKPGGKVKMHKFVDEADMRDTIDDLNERGFPVKACKCIPRGA
jgi:hypothetical protein